MGQPRILADRPVVTAAPFAPRAALAALEMPNPHVVVVLDLRTELDALDLSRAPSVAPGRAGGNALPEASRGEQNVEFVLRQGPRHLAMRVHERGVGETRSCGTGICAVVAAVATDEGHGADDVPWRVDVPGGTCQVVWRADGEIELTGPAVIVAEIDLDDAWLASVSAAHPSLDRR
jgi:diaminopimelate epimerase